VLKGRTINLRTVRKGDLEKLYELVVDIDKRGPFFPMNFDSVSSFEERFAKTGFWTDDRGMLLIVDGETDRILGQMVFFKPEIYYDAYEIGYIVYDPNDRGKGITTEAVNKFVDYLFDLKHVYRLQLQLNNGNVGSRRVAEKCGFKHEGTARHAIIVKGKPVDLEVYSITREDHERKEQS
jgi:ribosomal-protein-alanine N-acetyltransferase